MERGDGISSTDNYHHGRRSMGGQGDISSYFLKWRGRPAFCPPCVFRVDIFVLMHTVFIG